MLSQTQVVALMLFSAGFIGDVFFITKTLDLGSDARLFLFVIFWLLISKVAKFSSFATFRITLFFLALLSILFIFAREHGSIERIATWVYIFLLVGIVQQFIELRREKKHTSPHNA